MSVLLITLGTIIFIGGIFLIAVHDYEDQNTAWVFGVFCTVIIGPIFILGGGAWISNANLEQQITEPTPIEEGGYEPQG